jgi:hypothetical protein|tara:strand:+ start:4996 stop:7293 length:2298 start_codon:yes stop_codon:yes gene_type:complete
MALVINDRVKETTTTTGTGTVTLGGAVSGFETFSAGIGNSNTTYYCIVLNAEFEVGLGTLSSDSSTLARTTVISSSNSDSAVNFSAGTKFVFCCLPASKTTILDASNNLTLPGKLIMPDVTSGKILVADGTSYEEVALSGDATIASSGALTIANDAVEQAMIADDAVGADQLAASAVVTASIVDDNVTQAKIADDAVGADQLAANAVVNASVASDAAIVDTKLATISTANKVDIGALDIDGASDIGAALADADLIIVDDGAGGTEKKCEVSRVKTYIADVTLTTAAQTNITSLGTLTTLTVDNIIINGTNIGHTSDTDSIAIASNGVVTFSQRDVHSGGITIADGGQIGSASDTDAIAIGSDGDVTLTQDLELQHDGAILSFGANDEIALTHVHDTGLLLTDSGGTPTLQFHDANESFASDGSKIIMTSGGTAFNMPTADGSDGHFLKTDGSGTLTFAAASVSSLAADDLTAGDAAVTISTSSGNITIDAAANDSDIIFKGTDGGADTTFLTIDGSAAGAATFNDKIIATELDISGDIDVDGTTNLDVVDIDGAVDMASTLGVAGVVTANAGVVVDNITIDGTEIDLSSGDLTLDVAGDIILDADGGDVLFKDAGTLIGKIANNDSSNFRMDVSVQDKDFILGGNDGGTIISAMVLDMSAAGAATFNNDVTAFSDERLKKDIETIPNALDKVCQMRGVTFERIDDEGHKSMGVIAQEVEKIIPEVVREDKSEDKIKSVAYGNMVGLLIEAIKDLKNEVDELKNRS